MGKASVIQSYLHNLHPCTLYLNTLRPRQNGCHFADDTFKDIFVNENARIFIEFSLKFVPEGPINNILALVQIINGLAPSRPQAIIWTNDGLFIDTYIRHSASMS